MPLDTIKTQMQLTKGLGLMDCGKNIVKVDGVAGLYAGFPPFAVQASGKAAVRFFMYVPPFMWAASFPRRALIKQRTSSGDSARHSV